MAFTYGTINKCISADGSANNIYEVRFGYELQSQDTENNTSTIKLQLEVRSTSSSYKPYGYSQTTTIDGTTLSSATYDLRSTNVWQIFGTRTIVVNHNEYGEYTATKTGLFTSNVSGGRPKSGTASVSFTLPTIPMQSVRIKVNGSWKRAFPYVRVNGSWKKATAYIRVSGSWKRGS